MSSRDAVTAVRRFGLGPKPGGIQRIAADPRGFVLQSLDRPLAARITDSSLEASHSVIVRAHHANIEQQTMRAFGEGQDKSAAASNRMQRDRMQDAAPESMSTATAAPAPSSAAGASKTVAEAVNKPRQVRLEAYQRELAARIDHARWTEDPLIERLVLFWSNHFSVNADKGGLLGIVGAFEREAIRPHVLGRFSDMLLAVEQHPAMIIYLDNQASTGPNSQAGRNRKIGLNENLAREILELHTLGVDGGYSQADVTNLARLITGWTVGYPNQPNVEHGRFNFAAARHEPGMHVVLGKRYGEAGVEGGRKCLIDLARHPSTARHIARKLAVHFVSETPPDGLVAQLEKTFRDTDGDLAAVARALAGADEAWSTPPRKVVPPYDFVIALQRAFGLEQIPVLERARVMGLLGQPMWRPPSPKGWPDADETWAGPSVLRERLRVAERVSVPIVQQGKDARQMAEELFASGLSADTRQAIARAEAREQAMALLIMSPEFQRR